MKKIRYNIEELSDLLQLSPSTVYNRIANGEILNSYKDGKKIFVPRGSVKAYLEKRMRNACVDECHIKEMMSLI